jgi:hypothetical protein
VPARRKIPVGVSQNHCAMVKTVFTAFRRFDSMLVKGMLRLCHLLVIRLSCSAHPCVQLHFPLLSQHRVCNVLLDPIAGTGTSLAGVCSCGADIPVVGFGVCRSSASPAHDFSLLHSDGERDDAAQRTDARGLTNLRMHNRKPGMLCLATRYRGPGTLLCAKMYLSGHAHENVPVSLFPDERSTSANCFP